MSEIPEVLIQEEGDDVIIVTKPNPESYMKGIQELKEQTTSNKDFINRTVPDKNSNYLVTIQIPVSAIDDIDARSQAQDIENGIEAGQPYPFSSKLQRIYSNKAPEKINIQN